jgi:intracellular multiplication protein IcmJ
VVSLLPLVLGVGRSTPRSEAPVTAGDAAECRFCGAPVGTPPPGMSDVTAPPACALCGLALHLERPRINEEARLIWLPELSQPGLHAIIRRVHSALRSYGERLETGAVPSLAAGERPLLYHAQQAFLDRVRDAELRLGTSDPSDLADGLLRLSAGGVARRDVLLGGVRLLPMGRMFDGERDVYPQVVDSWRAAPSTRSANSIGGRA